MEKDKIRVSSHAVARYMERTGTLFNGDTAKELRTLVRNGVEITPKEVILHDFPLTRIVKGDSYILFHAKQPIIAVVSHDSTVKTIITKDMLSIPRNKKHAKNLEYMKRELKDDVRNL